MIHQSKRYNEEKQFQGQQTSDLSTAYNLDAHCTTQIQKCNVITRPVRPA